MGATMLGQAACGLPGLFTFLNGAIQAVEKKYFPYIYMQERRKFSNITMNFFMFDLFVAIMNIFSRLMVLKLGILSLLQVIQEDGRAERITIADDMKSASAQHALTEYKVIESFPHG